MNPEIFGSFIQNRRKELGLKQSDVAEKLHVTDKAVSRWERGVGFPDIRLLEPLADALKLTLTELMKMQITEGNAADTAEEVTRILDAQRKLSWQRKLVLVGGHVAIFLGALFMLWVIRSVPWGPAWVAGIALVIVIASSIALSRMLQYIVRQMYKREKPWGIWNSIHTWVVFILAAGGIGILTNAWRLHRGDPTWYILAMILGVGLLLAALLYYARHEYDIT